MEPQTPEQIAAWLKARMNKRKNRKRKSRIAMQKASRKANR